MGNCLCAKDEDEPARDNEMNPAAMIRTPSQTSCNSDILKTECLLGAKVVVALCSYYPRDERDLSFRTGDRLMVLNDSDSNWWIAQHLDTKNEGFIPRVYVGSHVGIRDRSIESKGWFFGKILRKEAEELLLMPLGWCSTFPRPLNPSGTFLIRNSEQPSQDFWLSVKDAEDSGGDRVKHYEIKRLDDGRLYVTPRHAFDGLQDLVAFYTDNSDGICQKLTLSCPRQQHVWDSPWLMSGYSWRKEPDLVFFEKLGGGNFAEVFHGKWRGKIEVAIKSLNPNTMSSEAFFKETSIVKTVRHEKLVYLFAVITRREPFYLITEYMCHGSLLDYLRNGQGRALRLHHLIDMAAQIGAGMMYLEENQLVHGDLAAKNVLVKDDNVVKIADFGLARIIEDSEYTARQGDKFPVKWTAPEAVLYNRFTVKSDVWSYGILLMELLTFGQVPYSGKDNSEVIDLVDKGYRMPKPSDYECPDTVYEVMLQCWDAVPDQRPTFEYLFAFFDKFPFATDHNETETPKT